MVKKTFAYIRLSGYIAPHEDPYHHIQITSRRDAVADHGPTPPGTGALRMSYNRGITAPSIHRFTTLGHIEESGMAYGSAKWSVDPLFHKWQLKFHP